ncbi:MAG: hypothetical protein JXQ75_06600 [Phycisphaerae bacterium]|nr:hypothetical protein [Phycisphaerae bacterium]
MNRINKSNWIVTLALCLAGVFCCATSTGCDEDYVMPGDFLTPSVEPADFSPFGYDYTMYDIFTEDI